VESVRLRLFFSGGATSQLMALASGIYIEKFHNRKFQLVYCHAPMSHTDGFVLGSLLNENEIEIYNSAKKHYAHVKGDRLWRFIPVFAQKYMTPLRRVYELAMRFGLFINLSIGNRKSSSIHLRYFGDTRSFRHISEDTTSISGNFWPGVVHEVSKELDNRFQSSGLPNIFQIASKAPNTLAIHYRLGDMRTDPLWKVSHGVMDPSTLAKRVRELEKKSQSAYLVKVFSDEPYIAKKLFESIGITEWEYATAGNIWLDIIEMLRAQYFIGSFSTVSMLVAEIHSGIHGFQSFLPRNARKHNVKHRQAGVKYFQAKTLHLEHWIYSDLKS
jgi:hypothetical protein